MEYAKDEIFSVKYNEKKNTLVFGNERTSSFIHFLRKNKFIKVITLLTIILGIANVVCIYNFFSILSRM